MRLKRISQWALVSSLLLVIAWQRPFQFPLAERREVYRAAVDFLRADQGPFEPWHLLLVAERTEAPDKAEVHSLRGCFLRTKVASLGELKEEFLQTNESTPSSLQVSLTGLRDVTPVPPSHYLDATSHFSWEELHRHYADKRASSYDGTLSLLFLSRIGFDQSGQRALVFVRLPVPFAASVSTFFFVSKGSGKLKRSVE